MPSTSSILERLRHDYPTITFQNAHVAHWSPVDKTVYHRPLRSYDAKITLLHELGHAINKHEDYHQDIELIRFERQAWQTAKEIAATYGLEIDDATIEVALDSYRHWLHNRSRCPRCHQGATQDAHSLQYRCLLCRTSWYANDARQCGLRRYTT